MHKSNLVVVAAAALALLGGSLVAGPAQAAGHATTGSWTKPALVDPRAGGVSDVSCTSKTFCVAVDAFGSALVLNGTTWGAAHSIDTTGLGSVSCASPTFCVAVDGAGKRNDVRRKPLDQTEGH